MDQTKDEIMKDDCQLSFITTKTAKEQYKAAAKIAGLSLAAWIRIQLNIQSLKQIQQKTPTIPKEDLRILCMGIIDDEILRTTKRIWRPTSTRRS